MKYRAGFLAVVWPWVVVLIQSLDAGRVLKKHASVSCRPKELTALTKKELEDSLTDFEEANGKHLGTWSPGFPELQVDHNSTPNGSKVQCSLLFMSQGLEEILEDQKNLNPTILLHEKLQITISRVKILAVCAKEHLGGECSPKPSPPSMPTHVFERKQWSHTLLSTARGYLGWLARKFSDQMSMVKGKNKRKDKSSEANLQKYFEGSGLLL